MSMINARTRHRLERLTAASPAEMVVILYEEAIDSIGDAIEAISRDDVQTRYDATVRATEILAHLAAALDEEAGGEIADRLAGIYRLAISRLTLVNVRNSSEVAEEVVDLLTPLLDAWRAIAAREQAAIEPEATGTFVPPVTVVAKHARAARAGA